MAFCTKCGAQTTEGTAFCGSCGTAAPVTSVDATASAPVPSGVAAGATPISGPTSASAGSVTPPAMQSAPMASNVAGLVAYVLGFVTGIFMLVSEPYKNDKFVRFHALQSIFLSGVYVVVIIAWSIFTGILFGALWQFVYLGWWLVRVAFFALWLFLMYKAYNNERFELPIIGPMAAKQAG